MDEKLFFYECYEASKFYRSGYILKRSFNAAKNEIKITFIAPVKIKLRRIGDETEEYCEQIKILRKKGRDIK